MFCVITIIVLDQMEPTYVPESLKSYLPGGQLRSSADQNTLLGLRGKLQIFNFEKIHLKCLALIVKSKVR